MKEVANQLDVLFTNENQVSDLSVERRKFMPVTVLYGGDSSERTGSILSGKTIESLLREAGYEHVTGFDLTFETILNIADKKKLGVAFVVMHGGFGEDGTLQGLLELFDIPYTGCGVAASAISADKALFNCFVRSLGYNVPNQIVISEKEKLNDLELTFPKVIKPATSGCSYGTFCVENMEELLVKSEFTRQFGDKMIIEDYIEGREFSVGILENPNYQEPFVLPITEIILKRKIQDFETKYPGGENLVEEIIPAELDSECKNRMSLICSDIFKKLNCRGYVRMDLRLTNQNEIYLLENNTSPGLISLEESDFTKMLQAGGISFTNFVDLSVQAALKNHLKKQKIINSIPGEREMVEYLGIKFAE